MLRWAQCLWKTSWKLENTLVEENENGMGKIKLLEMDDNTNGFLNLLFYIWLFISLF